MSTTMWTLISTVSPQADTVLRLNVGLPSRFLQGLEPRRKLVVDLV